jgi:hypothetical protein
LHLVIPEKFSDLCQVALTVFPNAQ